MAHHLLLPILLYPEIHFRIFRLFPSLLYRKYPEVVFDMPRRLGPGNDLPIVLILNDVKQFPVDVVSVQITLSHKSTPPRLFDFDDLQKHAVDHPFSFQSTVFVFTIPRKELDEGLYFVNCIARIKKGRRLATVINDNLFMTSKLPFSCHVSDVPLPGDELCSYGDLHVHSNYSQSHVEFGPPISVINLFSKCYGNDFVAITDHSYDLACEMENYLKIDNGISRWKSIKYETSKRDLNKTLLLGEEISCANSKKKTVHLCGIGIKDFIPGSSDGARRNANKTKTLTLEKAIESVHEQGGIAYAAHPGSKMGFMQRIFLKRGTWNQQDFNCKLDGIQAVNNGFGSSWNRAKKLWINELLKGHKLPLLGGNDSHGDFNRYRYLSIPFISIQETFTRYFAWIKTGVYKKVSMEKELIDSIKNGATFVSSGPFLGMSKNKSLQDNLICNNDNELNGETITIILKSTFEFGLPYCVKLFYGKINTLREIVFFSKYLKAPEFDAFIEVSISQLKGKGYLRAEAEFKTPDGIINYSATSPCYFNR
jgi:Predicted metal-dependent phosphoesterases (PHP family)